VTEERRVPPGRWTSERLWARDQLEEAEATEAEAQLAMRLLEVWWEDRFTAHRASDVKDIPSSVWRALGFFEELARGRALEPPAQADVRYEWRPAQPGQLAMRDQVRVTADAYDGQSGLLHNGREGRIVAIRYGDIHVLYDGSEPGTMPSRHSPHRLEKRYPA
jgi:hypothetical protein